MKKIFLFALVGVSAMFISADSCNNKKSSEGAAGSQPNTSVGASTTTASGTQQETAPKEETFRFIASFYSIGQGVDGIMHDKFVQFLQNYPKKIAYEPKRWGREGEVDYCLGLKELSAAEQAEFVNTAKDILSTHVNVTENAKCQHASAAGDEKYRLTVSFYSIGQGINTNRHEKFQTLLSNYNPKIKYELVKWGREGEVDYCLKLSELTAAQQEEFVSKVKEVVMPLVNVSENAKCLH